MKHKTSALAFIFSALIALSGCGQRELSASTTATPTAEPIFTEEPTPAPWEYTPIPNYTPRPALGPNPTDVAKATMYAEGDQTREAHETIIALTPSLPPPTYPPYHTPLPVDLPLGIIDSFPGYLGCDCTILNGFRGRLDNGYYIDVYAGASLEQREIGMVLVSTMSPNLLEITPWDIYETPIHAGSVHVVSGDGLQVTLLTRDESTQFVFDAGTRTWISPQVTPTTIPTASVSP